MKFVADDGKVFETIEDCEEYEYKVSLTSYAKYWHDNILMLDIFGKVVKFDVNTEDINFFDRLVSTISYTDVVFLIVPKECTDNKMWLEIVNIFKYKYESILPETGGVYRWQWPEDRWVSYEEDCRLLQERWKDVKNYIEHP